MTSQSPGHAKNLRLLDKMPAVYHDPIFGDELGHLTHYAAVVGTNGVLTAFSESSVEMKNVTILPLERLSEQDVTMAPTGELTFSPMLRRKSSQSSGSTPRCSVLGGPAAAQHDRRRGGLARSEDPLDQARGYHRRAKVPARARQARRIATPYSFGKTLTIHRAAPVLLANGLSIALLDTIEPSSLYALLTPESSKFIEWNKIPEARFAIYSSPLSTKLVVDCVSGRATITEPTLIEAGPPPRPIQRTPRLELVPGKGRLSASSVIELPYPYELGWTYEVRKVDPGGTAQIVAVGPSTESEWANAEAGAAKYDMWRGKGAIPEPWVFGGPCLMLVQPPVNGGEPRLFRVEVHVVGVMECTVELGKAGAAKIRTGDRCSLVGVETAEHLIRWLSTKMPGFSRPPTLTQDQFRRLLMAVSKVEGKSYPTTIVTEDQLRALPRVIPIAPARTEKPKAPESLKQARTLANLSEIGRAMKRFNERHTFWPPAVLVGPDGRPWHSWRVFLLPYLGHRDLFDQYDFSQPWDSAKNLRLLDKMPAVFHDPIYGDDLGHFTHYAALVGHGPGPKSGGAIPTTPRFKTAFSNVGRPPFETAFSLARLPMEGATIWPLERLAQGDVIRGADGELSVLPPLIFSDGIQRSGGSPGGCLAVAAVSPERKIPWTKPEDITVGPEFPLQLGKPGGIAAPYSTGKAPHLHRAAPVLFGDGKSSAIVDTIDPATFRAILNRWDSVQVDRLSQVPVARFAEYRSPPFTKLLIDCDNQRATITGPELVEPGVYTGAPRSSSPIPTSSGGHTRSRRLTPVGRPGLSGSAPRRRAKRGTRKHLSEKRPVP